MHKAYKDLQDWVFLSTPSGWRATTNYMKSKHRFSTFLSTPSGWRATPRSTRRLPSANISIHALRVEGDHLRRGPVPRIAIFLSTPSGWRATQNLTDKSKMQHISIHALRVEGDSQPSPSRRVVIISIHALRVEGDYHRGSNTPNPLYFYPRPPGGGRLRFTQHAQGECTFLSTPSGWRATRCFPGEVYLRKYFYPRPPGGGRQQKRTKFSSVFAQKGEEFASLRRGKRKICRWRFKKDKFWVLIWCEGSGKSVCASASHCG